VAIHVYFPGLSLEDGSTEEVIFSFRCSESHVYVGAGFAFTVQFSVTSLLILTVSVELECCGLSEEDRDTYFHN